MKAKDKVTLTATAGFENLRHGDRITVGGSNYVVSRRTSRVTIDAYPANWWRVAWYRLMRVFYK